MSVCLLVEVALLELFDQVENGLYLFLVGFSECITHVSLDWFELCEVEYEFWQVCVRCSNTSELCDELSRVVLVLLLVVVDELENDGED